MHIYTDGVQTWKYKILQEKLAIWLLELEWQENVKSEHDLCICSYTCTWCSHFELLQQMWNLCCRCELWGDVTADCTQTARSCHQVKQLVLMIPRLQACCFTKITEVNLFAFAYRLFHEDFSPIYREIILNLLPSLYTSTNKDHQRVCCSYSFRNECKMAIS